jgi:hypothetical protein
MFARQKRQLRRPGRRRALAGRIAMARREALRIINRLRGRKSAWF